MPIPPSGHLVAAWLLALRDVIYVPGVGPAEVFTIEQAAGECTPILVGYHDAAGNAARVEFAYEEQVIILRDSPARVA